MSIMKLHHGTTPVETIFVHCAATRPEWMAGRSAKEKAAEIRRWHTQDRGWRDIGYHWIIDRDGSIARGRFEREVGAHAVGHNTGSIGICLVGGHGSDARDSFADHFTPEQDAALRALIASIRTRADIRRVRGHNEVSNKACPGFQVAGWLAQSPPPLPREPIRSPAPSGWAAFIAALLRLFRRD